MVLEFLFQIQTNRVGATVTADSQISSSDAKVSTGPEESFLLPLREQSTESIKESLA